MIGVLKINGSIEPSNSKIVFSQCSLYCWQWSSLGKPNRARIIILFSQHYFGWLQLDPSTYFVTTVPVELPFHLFVGLNTLVPFVVCLLWFPSFVGRIRPNKSIALSVRF